jgi:hypothetical protein
LIVLEVRASKHSVGCSNLEKIWSATSGGSDSNVPPPSPPSCRCHDIHRSHERKKCIFSSTILLLITLLRANKNKDIKIIEILNGMKEGQRI